MGFVIVLATTDPETGNPLMISVVSEDLLCPHTMILKGNAGKATCFRADPSVNYQMDRCKWFKEWYGENNHTEED